MEAIIEKLTKCTSRQILRLDRGDAELYSSQVERIYRIYGNSLDRMDQLVPHNLSLIWITDEKVEPNDALRQKLGVDAEFWDAKLRLEQQATAAKLRIEQEAKQLAMEAIIEKFAKCTSQQILRLDRADAELYRSQISKFHQVHDKWLSSEDARRRAFVWIMDKVEPDEPLRQVLGVDAEFWDAKLRLEQQEAKLRIEQEAKLHIEQEAKLRIEQQEAKLRIEQEAKLRIEQEAKLRIEQQEAKPAPWIRVTAVPITRVFLTVPRSFFDFVGTKVFGQVRFEWLVGHDKPRIVDYMLGTPFRWASNMAEAGCADYKTGFVCNPTWLPVLRSALCSAYNAWEAAEQVAADGSLRLEKPPVELKVVEDTSWRVTYHPSLKKPEETVTSVAEVVAFAQTLSGKRTRIVVE